MNRAPLNRSDLAVQVVWAFSRHRIEVEQPEIIIGTDGEWTIGEAQKRANATASAYRRAADEIQVKLGAVYRLR
jgi:hypothetical protein